MIDGLYFHHTCSACGKRWYDFLPMLACRVCGSDNLVVKFDDTKREQERQRPIEKGPATE